MSLTATVAGTAFSQAMPTGVSPIGPTATNTLSVQIAPIPNPKARARLWDAIEQASKLTSLPIAASQSPEDAVTARCGKAYGDLMVKLFALNPSAAKGSTAAARELQFIPCPYWDSGQVNRSGRVVKLPTIPVHKEEALEPLVRLYMGSTSKEQIAYVARLNPVLVDASTNRIRTEGSLTLPFVSKPVTLNFADPQTRNSVPESVKGIVSSLPVKARRTVKIALSPDRYQLVAVSEPVLDDPLQDCGGPTPPIDWPFDLIALNAAYSATLALTPPALRGAKAESVVVVADTGVRLSDTTVKDRLWVNLPVLGGLPGPASNYRMDLHGASVVTRKGEAVDIEPGVDYEFAQHGTDVVKMLLEPGVRNSELDGHLVVAIAKLNDQSKPYEIRVEAVPAAIRYARTIGASVINLSVVTGDTSDDLEAAIAGSGSLIVAAAGNNSEDVQTLHVFPPATSAGREKLLVVGAHDWKFQRADFSNYGSSVDIFAPGCGITVRDPSGGATRLLSGTSFAAPYVAYAGALLRSLWMPPRPAILRNRIIASGRFDPALVGVSKYGVTLDIARAIRVREDSYWPRGANAPVYGQVDPVQNFTCLKAGPSKVLRPADVLKVITDYPWGRPIQAIWSQPSADGPLLESLCTEGIEEKTFSFRLNGEAAYREVRWSDVEDVVMRSAAAQ